MRSSVPRVVAVVSALALLPSAAHAARPVPVTGGITGEVEAASPDGTVLALDAGQQAGLRAALVGPSGRPSSTASLGAWGGEEAQAASSPDGSAAIAVPSDGNDHLALSFRPPGGAFAPLVTFSPDANPNTASSVATAGGTVLAGGSANRRGGSSVLKDPVVLRRRPDGTISPATVLPGGGERNVDDYGVQVGVDAAGRGLALWITGVGGARRVQAVTIAADGILGTPVALPGVSPGVSLGVGPSPVLVRVAPDGTGAVSWRGDGRTHVAPVTTTGGVDLSKDVSVPLVGTTALQGDGAAVVVSSRRAKGVVAARVASRAAGKPFSAVATRKGVRGGVLDVALDGGRWAAAFATAPEEDDLHPSSLLAGDAGGTPDRILGLPTASTSQLGLRVAVPGGSPLVLVRANREIEDQDGGVRTTGVRTETLRVAAGTPARARASFTLARSQRLGRPQVLRVTLRCRTACAYRVLGTVPGSKENPQLGGGFDVARTASRGTHTVRVPYQGPDEGGDRPHPLRTSKRARIAIAVDDAAGGETIWRRTVMVRP